MVEFREYFGGLNICENTKLFTCLAIIKPILKGFLSMTAHSCIKPDYSFGHRSMFLPSLVSENLSSLFRRHELFNENTI